MRNADDDHDRPLEILLHCPACGHDFPVDGKLDRHKAYKCPRCEHLFTFAGVLH